MTDKAKLLELAARLSDFNGRLESIANSNMTPTGQTCAVALLATTRAGLFRDISAALKALSANIGEEGK